MAASLSVIFIGILYSVMNLFNAQLSNVYGNYLGTIIIHICGLLILIPIVIIKKVRRNGAPLWMHMGGALGVITVLSTNVGVLGIGVTPTLALALIGQVVASMLIDQFGWFSFPKIGFSWKKIVSLVFIIVGTVVMFVWP